MQPELLPAPAPSASPPSGSNDSEAQAPVVYPEGGEAAGAGAEAALAAAQCILAKDNLRAYFENAYGVNLPFTFYTFRTLLETRVVDRTSTLASLSARAALHPTSSLQPVHSLSDPTATVAIVLVEGVEVRVRERLAVPASQMKLLLESLPTHFSQIIDIVLIRGTRQSQAARQFNTSPSSISRRVDDALTLLCSFLYSSRWPALPAPLAALRVAPSAPSGQ